MIRFVFMLVVLLSSLISIAQNSIDVLYETKIYEFSNNNKDTAVKRIGHYQLFLSDSISYGYQYNDSCNYKFEGEVAGKVANVKAIFYDKKRNLKYQAWFLKENKTLCVKMENEVKNEWIIYDDTLQILGLTCYKAINKKKDVLVWFTYKIPNNPVHFAYADLPGLVLYSYNATGQYELSIKHVKISKVRVENPNNATFTSLKEARKIANKIGYLKHNCGEPTSKNLNITIHRRLN